MSFSENLARIARLFTAGAGFTTAEQVQARTNLGMEAGFPMLHVVDEKATNTAGGSAVAGPNSRALNTVRVNEISGATLSSNVLTLPAGTYWVEGWATTHGVTRARSGLAKASDNVPVILGVNSFAIVNGEGATTFRGRLVLTAATGLVIRTTAQAAKASDGLGVAIGVTGEPEVYVELMVWKLR